MAQRFQKRTALIVLFLIALLGQGQEKKPSVQGLQDPCGMVTGVACGHISGNIYHNDYFGLSYTFPAGWKPIPQDIILGVHQKRAEKERNDALQQAHGKPVYLFESWDLLLVSKVGLPPPRDSTIFNSNVVVWADELSSQVHTLADQFEVSGFSRDPAGKLLKPLTQVTLAGRQFLRGDRLDQGDGSNVYHTRLVTFMRNYAIGMDFYSDDQAELEKLVATSETIQFQAQPDAGTVSGSTYHNSFFGFTYQLPAGLNPLDDYEMRLAELQQRQQHMKDFAAMPQVTVLFFTTYDLLGATAKPASTGAKTVSPWLRVWAEKAPFTTAPEDYFSNSTFLIDPDIKGKKLPAKMTVGGRTFARAERWGKAQGTRIYESRAATLYKDLTLVFEFGAGSQKELDDLVSSLNSLKFD